MSKGAPSPSPKRLGTPDLASALLGEIKRSLVFISAAFASREHIKFARIRITKPCEVQNETQGGVLENQGWNMMGWGGDIPLLWVAP